MEKMEKIENKSFFKTKEGILTIAFIIIMVAFFIILAGLAAKSDIVCGIGFAIMAAAMLYSPIKKLLRLK